MPYCPNCGTEREVGDQFCSACGEALEEPASDEAASERPPADEPPADELPSGSAVGGPRGEAHDDSADGWNWMDPRGPFRSPRTALNYFNGVGILLVLVALLLVVAGVDSPYAFLPDPLAILLVVYLLTVVFVGLPLAGLLLVTDNVLGFLRHG